MTLDFADQYRRAVEFRQLHEGPTFVLPNPWDAGTARVFTQLGYPALATTSGGVAFALGRADGRNLVTRDETLANVAVIAAATHLPVSADLESGFGRTPSEVAETIRLAAGAGAVGGSIEDATGDPANPIFPVEEAVQRVAAAAEAAHALDYPFVLTARAENFLHARPDLDDTIARLRSYEQAGADVLYAPALPGPAAIREVCAALKKPVNVLAGSSSALTVAELSACGVRRVSVGSSFARAALSAALAAAREVYDHGTFGYSGGTLSYAEVNALWPRAGDS
ncbi:MAG TPA: isocitrate lyase/phosphoenolpyruvate mutase family protein [Trebonia sp.]